MVESKNLRPSLVRFPNEYGYVELDVDMDVFELRNDFDDELFGMYGGVLIFIKK